MRAIALISTVVTLSAVTGCIAHDPMPAPTQQVNGLPPGVTQPEAVPHSVPNNAVDRLNVTLDECAESEGTWRASGEAANAADEAVTYEITVFFTTSAGTVIGFASTRVPVDAESTAPWRAESTFVGADDTQCVVRGAAVI